MIEFRNVSKAYRKKKVKNVILDDCSAEFPQGRHIGLLGRKGTGKSTVMRLISGSEFPDSGRIRRNVRISPPLGVTGLKGTMSARENCRFLARIYGMDTRGVERFVEEFTELGKRFDESIESYPRAMRSRVKVALSMAVDFECYLIDGGLSFGDAVVRERAEAMFKAKRETASIILVTHSPSQIRKFCDMGVVLHDGQLHFYDDLEDAIRVFQDLGGTLSEELVDADAALED